MIADLASLGLSPGHKERRKLGIGGSDANTLMSGDAMRIYKLWEEKTGRREPDDLSDVLPVMLGNWTEPFNAAWYQKVTGHEIRERNAECVSDINDFMRANLDGIVFRTTIEKDALIQDRRSLWEAKHVAGREDFLEEIVPRYTPQVYHNMYTSKLNSGVLSVIEGTQSFRIAEFKYNADYLLDLLSVERAFMNCVRNDTPPPEFIDIAPPPPVTKFRSVNMSDNKDWADHAQIWRENHALAKNFEKACDAIKEMVERDVDNAFGCGIVVKRSKNGALTIREEKPKKI
jgi:predicted phage-related endonuclease